MFRQVEMERHARDIKRTLEDMTHTEINVAPRSDKNSFTIHWFDPRSNETKYFEVSAKAVFYARSPNVVLEEVGYRILRTLEEERCIHCDNVVYRDKSVFIGRGKSYLYYHPECFETMAGMDAAKMISEECHKVEYQKRVRDYDPSHSTYNNFNKVYYDLQNYNIWKVPPGSIYFK